MSEDSNGQAKTGGELDRNGDTEKLVEAGNVQLAGEVCQECRVTRSMPVISVDGEQVGWVAAVMSANSGQSTVVLLARPQITLQYHLLPPGLIAQVADGKVLLRVTARAAENLPPRQMT